MRRQFKLPACLLIVLGLAGFTMQPLEAQSSGSFKLPMVTDVPWLPDGTPVHIDLAKKRYVKNTGGKGPRGPGSGSGLCVFTSIMHACDWHHIRVYNTGFQKWMMDKEGGGWPEKLTKMMRQFAEEMKIEMPDLLQNTNGDLDLLAETIQKGYLPGCTYCWSPTGRYGGGTISHMLNPVAGRAITKDGRKVWCVVDNNYPGTYEWMEEQQFAKTFKGNGGGWSVYVVAPEPPPIPKNME